MFCTVSFSIHSYLDGRAQFPLFDVSVRRSTHGDVERFRAYYWEPLATSFFMNGSYHEQQITVKKKNNLGFRAWKTRHRRDEKCLLFCTASSNDAVKLSSQKVCAAAAGRARIYMHGLSRPALASWLTLSDLLTPADIFPPFLTVFSSRECL